MEKIRLVYVLFGISPRIWNGLRTYTEVPLYFYITCLIKFINTINEKLIANERVINYESDKIMQLQIVLLKNLST
jgi:hypothetical protein